MKFLVLFTAISVQYLFALISIAPMEIGEKSGLHTNVALAFETKRGNTYKDNYKGSTRVSYDDNKDYVTWGEISAEYGEANKIEDTNKLYIHLRYIHALTEESIRYELFGQIQEDKFKLIKHRVLGGVGLRFKIFEIFKDARGYLGIGIFHEQIKYTRANPNESNIVLNNYFAYTAKFGNNTRYSYTLYYQPKIDYFSDSLTSQKLELQLQIYKELFLNFQVAYDVDSRPVRGVKEYDFTQSTSFVYKF